MPDKPAKFEAMDQYLDAWQRHDPAAVRACFAAEGKYFNPAVPQGISGEAIEEMVAFSLAGFSDLQFEILSAQQTDSNHGFVQWIMRGTNDGPPAPDVEPTGKKIHLPGCNVFAFEGTGIQRCDVYFDQMTYMNQLGLI